MDIVKTLLLRLGIRSTLRGFHFLWYALHLCLQNEDYLLSVSTKLYAAVAEHYNTSRGNVEHCIRTAIANCCNNGNWRLLNEIAGYELNHRPSNGAFIDILYHYLKTPRG